MYDIDQNGTIELQEMQKVLHSMFEILSFKKKMSREETCDEVAENDVEMAKMGKRKIENDEKELIGTPSTPNKKFRGENLQ